MKKRITALFVASLAFGSALAMTLDEVTHEDQTQIGGKTLVLNGMGTRKATLLKVKVYVAGLYVENKTGGQKDGDAVLASPETKMLRMRFVRDVGADKLKDAWVDGFDNNAPGGAQAFQAGLSELQSMMPDVKSGDLFQFTFQPTGVDVQIEQAGKVITNKSITGPEFSKALLSLWLGKDPPNGALKDGLLGKN